MIRLTYASSAVTEFEPEELLLLLKNCKRNNSARNITGILLYTNRTFFQVLEGDETSVDQLYATIKKDPRHQNCTVLERQEITERAFPYWSMGFENINPKELHKMEGLQDFFEKDFTPTGLAAHKHILGPLLSHLRTRLINQVTTHHEELPIGHEDPFIRWLHTTIRFGVKILALLMVVVIFLGIFDVLHVLYAKVSSQTFILSTNDLLETFGAFLAVLIAIEIFLNITLYIRSDIIPVKLVVATALMAISRKIIVFDYKHLDAEYVSASAWVLLALGITYWLIQKHD